MKYFLDLLNLEGISFTTIGIVAILLYLGFTEVRKHIKQTKKEHNEELQEYHETESNKERKEKSVNNRLDELENYIDTDYKKIQKMEAHLYEITNGIEGLTKTVDTLNTSVRDMKLDDMREILLNAPSQVIDMSRPVSAELYNNIFNTYTKYEALLKEAGKENGQAELSMQLVRSSWLQRTEAGMFSEQLYLTPEQAKTKIKEVGINLGTTWNVNNPYTNIDMRNVNDKNKKDE